MKYQELYDTIKAYEREIAPGSESALWGRFVSRMYEIDIDPHDPQDQTISDDESQWWLKAYDRYSEIADVEDVQEFFDSL